MLFDIDVCKQSAAYKIIFVKIRLFYLTEYFGWKAT